MIQAPVDSANFKLAPLSRQHFLILDFQRGIDNDSLCKVFKGGVFFQMPIKNSLFSFKFRQFNLEERLLSIPPTYLIWLAVHSGFKSLT